MFMTICKPIEIWFRKSELYYISKTYYTIFRAKCKGHKHTHAHIYINDKQNEWIINPIDQNKTSGEKRQKWLYVELIYSINGFHCEVSPDLMV